MLARLKRALGARALGSILSSLATSADTRTTVIGMAAGALIAAQGLDLQRLMDGDAAQIARASAAMAVAMLGWLATKERAAGTGTLVGVVAGGLYAISGSVEAVVTGAVLAVLGHVAGDQGARRE